MSGVPASTLTAAFNKLFKAYAENLGRHQAAKCDAWAGVGLFGRERVQELEMQ
jgi:hypothetical protein